MMADRQSVKVYGLVLVISITKKEGPKTVKNDFLVK